MTYEKGKWYRAGATVFVLRHANWHKCPEQLENKFYFRIDAPHDVDVKEREQLAQEICDFLNESRTTESEEQP